MYWTFGIKYTLIFQPVRFAVRSLGWTEIAEEELTPEKSSRAVNRAIVDLSTGRNDLIDNVSKWGDVSLFIHSAPYSFLIRPDFLCTPVLPIRTLCERIGCVG